MPTVTIQVTDCSENTVTMNNNGNATANHGDFVLWNVTGAKIESITITQVSGAGETQIWSSLPAPFPNSDSKNWRGTIGNVGSVHEDYTITAHCDGQIISHDPRISVNPK
ncbi:hypothetical protein [Eudoraea adriatica]|uniref:hypothetical protein n=1 Tax=Eudoraea adriatica TaxID=446681 RepID=UPI00035DA966|nr:hypothetical protein [Eudoraea adriatica]